MKIDVLVTTMHQQDFSKYSQMNLQTDAVIANQANSNSYAEQEINGHTVKLVTTNTRGTSRNRNIALCHSTAEYVLFSDDDLVFVEGYKQLIQSEFANHPEADAIKFNLYNISSTRKISMKQIEKFEPATRRNMGGSGVWGLVIKRDVLIRNNLYFREDFGPGTENYCGEDTIFLQKLVNAKIGFFRSPIVIAGIDQTTSTWFDGHNEKYFMVNGKILASIYPHIACLLAIRSAYRFSKRSDCKMSFIKTLKCYFSGIKSLHRARRGSKEDRL
ncbi:MAG: glycosyltransferase family 2 protein [Oscillospiraceae bacterium]|nr:glycosyltransferase family 2 protein [Oscillospiraceae bacterium]